MSLNKNWAAIWQAYATLRNTEEAGAPTGVSWEGFFYCNMEVLALLQSIQTHHKLSSQKVSFLASPVPPAQLPDPLSCALLFLTYPACPPRLSLIPISYWVHPRVVTVKVVCSLLKLLLPVCPVLGHGNVAGLCALASQPGACFRGEAPPSKPTLADDYWGRGEDACTCMPQERLCGKCLRTLVSRKR